MRYLLALSILVLGCSAPAPSGPLGAACWPTGVTTSDGGTLPPDCMAGYTCATNRLASPGASAACMPRCDIDEDCRGIGDARCVHVPSGNYCAIVCATLNACPSGTHCQPGRVDTGVTMVCWR